MNTYGYTHSYVHFASTSSYMLNFTFKVNDFMARRIANTNHSTTDMAIYILKYISIAMHSTHTMEMKLYHYRTTIIVQYKQKL